MLKELLAPTVKSNTITIRQDEGTGLSEHSDGAGRLYPMVRIADTTLDNDEIEFFEISTGLYQMIPSLILNISDDDYKFRERLKPRIDVLTLYLGTNRDEYFIKNDYLIESIISTPGYETVTIMATLHIPKLHEINIRGFKNQKGIDVIQTIAKEAGLGLLVNFQDTLDTQTYLQDNKSNLEFLRRVTDTMYSSDDTSFIIFIDHWSYLNVIDLKAMYGDRQIAKTDTHPYTGKKLDSPVNVVLSNQYYSDEVFKVGFWSQQNSYTIRAKEIPQSIKLNNISDVDTKSSIIKNQISAATEQLLGIRAYQSRQSDNVHASYGKLKVLNRYNRDLYDQDQKITLELNNLSMVLYPSMYVPVNIYNSLKKVTYDNQSDPSVTNDQLAQQALENRPQDVEQVLNTELTGNYGITEVKWRFYADERLMQTVNCIRLDTKIDNVQSDMNTEAKKKQENKITPDQLDGYSPQDNTADAVKEIEENTVNMNNFFDAIIKAKLFKSLTEEQKAYFKNISSLYTSAGFGDLRYIAYTYATTYHETAQTMRPIDEFGKGAGRPYGIPDKVTGKIYYGRGYVQLTWKDNYAKFSPLVGVDLVNFPEKANDPAIAIKIQMVGMTKGLYTGKGLKDYFTSQKTDWVNARRIINGTDKAQLIAGNALLFYNALKEADGVIS